MKYKRCCKKAFLSGLIHTCALLSFDNNGLSVRVDCDYGVEFIQSVFDSLYLNENNCRSSCESNCKNNFKNNCEGGNESNFEKNMVDGKFVFFHNADGILKDLEIFHIVNGKTVINEGICEGLIELECCKKAYLAGAFFGCGLLDAANGYNLEFITASKALSLDLCRLLSFFGIKAGNGRKDGRFRTYIKYKEGVSDALAAIGASKTVLKINSLIAQRDLKRELVRRANCDVYNVGKSISASVMQIEAIKNLNLEDEKLIETAQARLKFPEASYDELKDVLHVSKSTVKYRLQRIVNLYKKEREKK